MCVYDAEFSVRPVEGEQYEIYGVAEGSVAYQVGIRDGDFACGFKHYNEDGRSKSHAWCEDTLDELKDIGVFFIDVLKNPPFGKAALRDCMKREKYVSKIKVRCVLPLGTKNGTNWRCMANTLAESARKHYRS
jgi:hypothetical protein